MKIRAHLFAAVLLCVSIPTFAADIWFYEWRAPQTQPLVASDAPENGRRWIVTEFSSDPYPGQLLKIAQSTGFERATMIFTRPPAPALAQDYVELARSFKQKGITLDYKFTRSFPTEDEARMLQAACDLGTRISFISAQLPTEYESANLKMLAGCVRVVLAIGHYPRSDEMDFFTPLKGLPLTLVNNYYPSSQHVDVLNRLETPLVLQITDSAATAEQIAQLNRVERLTSQHISLNYVPSAEQYRVLHNVNRANRFFSLKWDFGQAQAADVEAWASINPDRLQVSREAFESTGLARDHRRFSGEIIVEMFPVGKLGPIDEVTSWALKPTYQ